MNPIMAMTLCHDTLGMSMAFFYTKSTPKRANSLGNNVLYETVMMDPVADSSSLPVPASDGTKTLRSRDHDRYS